MNNKALILMREWLLRYEKVKLREENKSTGYVDNITTYLRELAVMMYIGFIWKREGGRFCGCGDNLSALMTPGSGLA